MPFYEWASWQSCVNTGSTKYKKRTPLVLVGQFIVQMQKQFAEIWLSKLAADWQNFPSPPSGHRPNSNQIEKPRVTLRVHLQDV